MSKVHAIAQSGFAEGTNDLYDRARPSYPSSALGHIHSALPSSAHRRGLRILEPGAGTGIFTRLLVAPPAAAEPSYPEWNIEQLTSIEPSEGMRAAWARGMEPLGKAVMDQVKEGRVRIVDGVFDDFSGAKKTDDGTGGRSIKEGEADLVVIAQAFHWCPDYEAAFAEIAEYLSPDGVLVLIWNLETGGVPWIRKVRDLFEPYDLGTPQYYRMEWRKGFEAESYKSSFEPAVETTFGWDRGLTDQGILDRILSKSYLTEAHLNGEKREQFIRDMRALLAEAEPEKEYIDREKGLYRFHYETNVVVIRKKASQQ